MFPEGRLLDFLIVGVVALIVVGPKDLPILMRKVGQFMARMRGMAAEFRASFDEMARQSELDELRKEVDALRAGAASATSLSGLGLGGETGAKTVFDDIHAGMTGGAPQMTPFGDYRYPARLTPEPAPPAAEPPDGGDGPHPPAKAEP